MGMLSNCNSAAVVRMDKEENKQYAGRAAVLCCRVAAPAAAVLSHRVFLFFWHVSNRQDNKPDSRGVACLVIASDRIIL